MQFITRIPTCYRCAEAHLHPAFAKSWQQADARQKTRAKVHRDPKDSRDRREVRSEATNSVVFTEWGCVYDDRVIIVVDKHDEESHPIHFMPNKRDKRDVIQIYRIC